MLSALGNPAAKQSKFNVCMDEPVDYGEVAAHLAETRGLPSLECQTVRLPQTRGWLRVFAGSSVLR